MPTFAPTFPDLQAFNLDAPTGGLVDTPQLGKIPPDAATAALNCVFDDLSIKRRLGRVLIGDKINEAADLVCQAGFQFRKRDGTSQMVRVQGPHLYVLTGGVWLGAVSGMNPATADDIIGNDSGLGVFVQFNDRCYWLDGGAERRYWDGAAIGLWGFQGGAIPAGIDVGPASGGALVEGKTYSYVWGLLNPTTGVRSELSAKSPDFKVGGPVMTLPKLVIKAAVAGGSMTANKKYEAVWTMLDPVSGDESTPAPVSATFKTTAGNKARKVRIGPFADWDTDYTTINIYRSKADAPGTWYLETSIAGIVNFKTVAQNYTLTKSDAALGAAVATTGDLAEDISIGPWAGWSPDYLGFTTIEIFRTYGDIPGAYYFDQEVTGITNFDTVPVTATLSISDEELQTPAVEFDVHGPPPPVMFGVLYGNQIVAVPTADPSSIVYSRITEIGPEVQAFPLNNKQYCDRDAGDPITALWVDFGRLYIAKRFAGVFAAESDGFGGVATPQKLNSEWGCVRHHSVVHFNGRTAWWDQKGAPRFDGQTPELFSDRKIRQTTRRFTRSSGFADTVGLSDSQPDKPYLRWIMQDPDDGFKYHLVCDVSKESWFTELAGRGAAAGGGRDRTSWLVRDTDGRRWVYTADDQGRCFRLRTNEAGADQWSDAGQPFRFHWRSAWLGDGIHSYLPLYVNWKQARSATGKKQTMLTLNYYRDMDLSAPYTEQFALKDSTDTNDLFFARRMNLNAEVCRYSAIEFVLDGLDSDLDIWGIELQFKPIPSAYRLEGQ